VLCEPGGKKVIRKMAGRIIIDIERCKGCGLCVAVCPKNGIAISKKSNKSGYFPAQPVPSGVEGPSNADNFDKLTTSCTGCAVCAIVCPEAVIAVYREDDTEGKPKEKKSKPISIKEKA
jgi:2-oxoglutarate ferredoxin oxidoreductase subunit delta